MRNIGLSLFSALLLFLGVYFELGILLFVAFVPLLIIENSLFISEKGLKSFLLYSFFPFIAYSIAVFNLLWRESILYFFVVIVVGILYAVVFSLFHLFRQKINNFYGYFLFLGIVVSVERLFLLTDSPLNAFVLGQYISGQIWYSLTGVLGGSLWILIINLLFYNLIEVLSPFDLKNFLLGILSIGIVIGVPLVGNKILLKKLGKVKVKKQIKVYVDLTDNQCDFYNQIDSLSHEAFNRIDSNVDFTVFNANKLSISKLYVSDSLLGLYNLLSNKINEGVIIFEKVGNRKSLKTLSNNSLSVGFVASDGIEFYSKYSDIEQKKVVGKKLIAGIFLGNEIYNGKFTRVLVSGYSDFLIFNGSVNSPVLKNRAIESFENILSVKEHKIYTPDGREVDFEGNLLTINALNVFTYYIAAGDYLGNLMTFLSVLVLIAGFSKMSMDKEVAKTLKK